MTTPHQRLRLREKSGTLPPEIAGDIRALLADHASQLARLKKAEVDRARLHAQLIAARASAVAYATNPRYL